MNEIERAIKTISDIYAEYLLSETDTVNLAPYDKGMQDVHTFLEQSLQDQQERDEAMCENCCWRCTDQEDDAHYCTFWGDAVPDGAMIVKASDCCSHFEKE